MGQTNFVSGPPHAHDLQGQTLSGTVDFKPESGKPFLPKIGKLLYNGCHSVGLGWSLGGLHSAKDNVLELRAILAIEYIFTLVQLQL